MKKSVILLILLFLCSNLSITCGQTVCREYSPKYTANTLLRIQQHRASSVTRALPRTAYIQAYLRVRPETNVQELCNEYGIKLNVGYNDLYTALIPMENLEPLTRNQAVLEIDAGQEVRSMMDSARIFTHVEEAYNGTGRLDRPYRGNGVLIGIIDTGLDFGHPNFRDANGHTRIRAVWDQNNFMAPADTPYGYGVIYDTPEEVTAAKKDMELTGDTHGTHVTGIAAGSYNGPYRGVAPEASIVLVSTNKTEQGIMDGIDFLIKYAENAGMPVAINLSIGTILGYKDGTDNFTILTDRLLEGQKGKLLSIAAGNEGDRESTLAGTFNAGKTTVKSLWIPPAYGRDNLFIQGEKEHTYRLVVTLKDTVNQTTLFSETFTSGEQWSKSYEKFGSGKDNNARINISSSLNPVNENPNFRITMTYTQPNREIWEITLTSPSGKYMINSDYGRFISKGKKEYDQGTADYTIACTATGHIPIAVGAFVSRKSYRDLKGKTHISGWEKEKLYPLSGKGPTYDGRIKPDVTAPGATIISSFSSYAGSYYVQPEDKVFQITDETNNRTYSWGIANGTSMATPVVTGTLALWLEVNPQLTAEKAKEVIKNTAYHDLHTGHTDNSQYGMGKLDATAGLEYLLRKAAIESDHHTPLRYIYDKAGSTLRLISEIVIKEVRIYRPTGTLQQQIAAPGNTVRINLQPGNIYLIKVTTDKTTDVFKIAS